ncbi:MAG: PQQ-dependent sugar dehydrogenase [Candidatus Marinimicrobia bacterium]|jgi:glucose/arabinose dehydrogenase|nr:PQQ-dependent sugar dehydrogenase [Candidatus Neomarinimicrobiota bacterium]MBT4132750.1 PQQ-dependent sugar dehydrogenase [Candidatus Neomarinimicrobiota bacterium]MBT5315108.1 PQQ-dependent sugar dehydrogenase [Candidatus Neomarinimicrobiota bacterium]MBT5785209.1 PQQ-dependent sugar dehydrogenase [Candidatus Neomarinimicrobiota bacterium]MBT6302746.1 PQQ-dependent sugar dehydrogenase [Candidatus Neomarinimicrobiota bacterium]
MVSLRKTSILLILLAAGLPSVNRAESRITGSAGSEMMSHSYGTFNEAWAMTFLPDGQLLVTQKTGELLLVHLESGSQVPVQGVPEVAYGGQGGLGDIILHPQYLQNQLVYFSYAESGPDRKRGAVVARARLQLTTRPRLEQIEIIWRQSPKVTGKGHYSHRLAFGPQGYLFITSGDRQKQEPAQSWTQDLGKVTRLNDDGSIPPDNPFQDKGSLAKSFWTLGHRNLLGIAFNEQGQLWTHEMGPQHGDEFNLIIAGENYGWPLVSWGNHYSGFPIDDHDTRPDFHLPEEYWVPTIAPSGLIIYNGDQFPAWRGNAFIGGLRSEALIRVSINGNQAQEVERFDMGKRIREVEQGPQGALWVLEDREGGRLLRLTPRPE